MASDVRLKEQLPDLTNRIVATYRSVGIINHLGHCPLPNYEVVIEIMEDLKEILYPGYRRREGLHFANVTYHVGDLIDRLHDQLTQQIARALRHESSKAAQETDDCDPDIEALAQAKTIDTGIIGNRGDALNATVAQGGNQGLGNSAQSKAANRKGLIVGNDALKRLVRIRVNFRTLRHMTIPGK